MDLKKFRETLLEFLGEVTTISEKAVATFLNQDGWVPNKAPDGYTVLTDYLLVKEETFTRIPDRPKPIPDEGETNVEEKPETFHCIIWFRIYTEKHRYNISAVWKDYSPQYLGMTVSNRTPRAGENWTRGNDLHDGYFCRETWEKIKNDIIKNEMEPLSKYIANGRYDRETVEEFTK